MSQKVPILRDKLTMKSDHSRGLRLRGGAGRRPQLFSVGLATHVLKQVEHERLWHEKKLLNFVRKECERIGLCNLARKICINPANLLNILSGNRRLSRAVLGKLEKTFLH